jgi:hypothetical protein
MMAHARVSDLSLLVVEMQAQQMELLATVDRLSEEVTGLQREANGALGIGMDDSTDSYEDDDEDDDPSREIGGPAPPSRTGAGDDDGGTVERAWGEMDGEARTFQRQIDRVSVRLAKLNDEEHDAEGDATVSAADMDSPLSFDGTMAGSSPAPFVRSGSGSAGDC